MCYEVLQDGSATERRVPELLGLELRDAVVNGVEAAALVTLVLLWQGTPLWLVLASGVGAVVLGTLVHQAVLLAGVGFVRLRSRGGASAVAST